MTIGVLKSHLVYVHVDNDIKNFRGGGLMDLILVIMKTMTWQRVTQL